MTAKQASRGRAPAARAPARRRAADAPAPERRGAKRARRSAGGRGRAASRLERLPDDLLLRILPLLPDTAALASLGATCKALRAVVTHNTVGVRAAFTDASFAACLRSLPRLERLEVKAPGTLWDASPLAQQRHLTRLACPCAPFLNESGSLRFVPPSVVELDIRGATLTPASLLGLSLARLRVLDMRDAGWGGTDPTPHLAACTSLEVLGMSCEGRDCAKLWAALGALPVLREVMLTLASFDGSLDPATAPRRLRALSLAHSHVADLGSLLPHAGELRSLRLDLVLSEQGAPAAELPALEQLALSGARVSAARLRTPPLRRLWLAPSSGGLDAGELPPPAALAGVADLALVGVRACEPAAAAALARLPLRALALARCGAQLQARLLAPREAPALPQLESLAVAHTWGERPQPLAAMPQRGLRLLLGNSRQQLLGLQAQPEAWQPCPPAAALPADLAEFISHAGRWHCFVKDEQRTISQAPFRTLA